MPSSHICRMNEMISQQHRDCVLSIPGQSQRKQDEDKVLHGDPGHSTVGYDLSASRFHVLTCVRRWRNCTKGFLCQFPSINGGLYEITTCWSARYLSQLTRGIRLKLNHD